jgi:hypothetical protein
MSSSENDPQSPAQSEVPADATQPLPPTPAADVPVAAAVPPPAPVTAPVAAPVTAPGTPQAATWPPAAALPPQRRERGAWIRALSPLTAGILSGLLLLAGFGVGVVVGWHHDRGDRVGPAGFSQGQRNLRGGEGLRPGQRGFGYGPGFGAPGQRGQQRQPGQPGQQPNLPNRSNQAPTPSPSATS